MTEDTGQKPPAELLTRQQIAEVMGVDPGTITRWERDGMPVAKRAPRGQPSLFDPAAVQQWRDDISAVKMLAQSGLSLEAERARLTRAQAEKVERENLRRAGELVPRDEVSRAGQAFCSAWAAKVRGIPRRMTQAGFITRDQEPIVSKICREILIEISSWTTMADVEKAAAAEQPKRKKKKKKAAKPPESTPPPPPATEVSTA